MVYPPEEDAAGRAQGADALIATAPAEFPATGTLTYMNVGSRGLMSRRVRAALGELLDDHTFGAGNREAWKTAAAEARALFARLINAATDEVVLTRNTSDGLNALANAMPWQSGDNMVVTPDLEEPTTIYAWYNLRRLGVEVRDVLPRGPFYDIERMVDAIDSRTRLLVACSETWAPGLRTDIDTLGRACRERGVFFVVDAVQSAGVMPLDVERSCIDGLSAATYKSLLGLHGMGFLYCRREWAERLRPAYLAREGVELASARAFQRREGEYALGAGTGRFQIGHLNYVASTAVRTSLDYLLEIGATAIEAHVSGLANRLAAGLIELGLGVASGQPGPHFGHLVCVGTPGFGDSQLSTGDEALDRLARFLEARDVVFSIRNGQLRFALHLYNTEADVERVLVLTREQLG